MFGRKKSRASDDTLVHDTPTEPTKWQLKRATRTRKIYTLVTALLLLVSVVFTILVEVGNTNANSSIRTSIYFIKLDLADIIPVSVPNARLINSIAQTLGLHDYYTVGLWGWCMGNYGEGITFCSKPETLYWFNPVEIIQSQLLAGATIALPAQIDDILNLIKLASQWMFALFLSGACLSFVTIFIAPLSVYSRWASLPITLLTFLSALMTTVATVIATVLFTIAQSAVTSADELNIGASIGIRMFVFMWIAAAAAILAFVFQLGMCCCCASRRDVRTGRKRGSKKAWRESGGLNPAMREKSPGRLGRDRSESRRRESRRGSSSE